MAQHSKIDKSKKMSVISNIFKEFKGEISPHFPDYHLKGSAGSGGLAEVPWFMFSNPEISKGASKGYYIVMLFDSRAKNVVFSLLYSWTTFKKKYKKKQGIINAERWSTQIKNRISNEFDLSYFDSNTKSIGFGELAQGYVAGTIISKTVPVSELNRFDFNKTMLLMGNYYKFMQDNLLGALSMDDFINNTDETKSIDETIKKTNKEYFESIKYTKDMLVNGYDITSAGYVNERAKSPIARDSHKARREGQSIVGDQGEEIVYNFEKMMLEDSQYSPKILTTDGDGYDVLSYDEDGNEKQIEVKAVKSMTKRVTFYISQNELDRARELDNYYLYIVVGVGTPTPRIVQYYKPFGKTLKNDYKGFNLIATKYKVTIDLKN